MRIPRAAGPRRKIPALLLAIAGLITWPSFASAAPGFREYVALGDSWSADSTPMLSSISIDDTPPGCAQAVYDYPKQVAAAIHVKTFRDATCGSATTDSLSAPQGVPLWGVNPAQFDRLTPTTDLVTLGIGGNDAGLAGAVMSCIDPLLVNPCEPRWVSGGVDQMSVWIAEAEPKVAAAIDGIRARSPRATILLVDYFQGMPEAGCWPIVPIADGDVRWLRAKLEELNAMLKRVAAVKRVRFVDTYSTSAGHDVCQLPGTAWVEGLTLLTTEPLGLAVPFHPNRLGADHQARMVLRALGS